MIASDINRVAEEREKTENEGGVALPGGETASGCGVAELWRGLHTPAMEAQATRMFPLGSVLFPHAVLPLQIFEHRYLTMIDEAMRGDGSFGVVLIEKGSEVGGGDARFQVGTLARIVRAGRLAENRLMIVTVGTTRVRVVEWLDDAPYPLAITEPLDDGPTHGEGMRQRIERTSLTWRKVMALAIELGADIRSIDIDLPEAPDAAVWTLCGTAPIEQRERQRLLEIDDPGVRLDALEDALQAELAKLEAKLL
jgi:Lon protease-like protein